MTTTVHLSRTSLSGARIFRTNHNESLFVTSFEKGIAYVTPALGSYIDSFAETIAGCFDESSNFENELALAFGCTQSTTLTGIHFSFNGSDFFVTKENANKNAICDEWLIRLVK